MTKEITITIEVDALNIDIIHWIMSCVDAWNTKMIGKMKVTKFEADGMVRPFFEAEKLQEFYAGMDLPYNWAELLTWRS